MISARRFAQSIAIKLPLQLALGLLLTATVWAAPAADSVTTRQEVQALQAQLARVNAEIKALKAAPRSLSVDYRLRQDLADAEALARKLTEAEAKVRSARSQPEAAPKMAPEPTAQATDGPAELAAKADILLDQAQKLTMQADRIEARAERERVRGTLRARTRHLEQDPFVTLEGAKRSVVLSRTETKTTTLTGNDTSTKTPESAPAGDFAAPPASPGVAGSANAPPRTNLPPPEPTTVTTTSVSLSFRALLDARALAEVERIERSGDPQAQAKALAAAVASLRKQARELQGKAAALRNTK
ncbi:MAG: hypothetical protein SF187_06265 [Deltaproteobacteria bacterium]|nr:hypothetical protein [Deltaproteobacteria bacterium]